MGNSTLLLVLGVVLIYLLMTGKAARIFSVILG